MRFYEQDIAFFPDSPDGKSLDAPLMPFIERPWPLVAGFQVASPIAVKSSSLSAASLTATTLRHSIFAFLASVRLETIRVHPYEGTLPSPTNHVTYQPLLSSFLSLSLSSFLSLVPCRAAELNGLRNVAAAKKICIVPTHIRSHSRIQSILLSNATVLSPLDDEENRAEFIGHLAVIQQTGPLLSRQKYF